MSASMSKNIKTHSSGPCKLKTEILKKRYFYKLKTKDNYADI